MGSLFKSGVVGTCTVYYTCNTQSRHPTLCYNNLQALRTPHALFPWRFLGKPDELLSGQISQEQEQSIFGISKAINYTFFPTHSTMCRIQSRTFLFWKFSKGKSALLGRWTRTGSQLDQERNKTLTTKRSTRVDATHCTFARPSKTLDVITLN